MVSALGGSYAYVMNKSVTHYLYEGKMIDTKEIKSIKNKELKIVSPVWLEKCFEYKRYLPEAGLIHLNSSLQKMNSNFQYFNEHKQKIFIMMIIVACLKKLLFQFNELFMN
jgi:hypothetical protein